MSSDLKIGFLGAGKMATALAAGFVRAELVSPANIVASDPVEATRTAFISETEARAVDSNLEVVRSSPVVFIAVKPAQVAEVLAGVRADITPTHLLVSIAAGVPLARLEAASGSGRVVRIMPNTPALVGACASAFACGPAVTEDDARLVQDLLSSIGLTFQLNEPLLDAVTGLSGSGPAYGFLMIEALSDGGVAAGLPREIATQLAAQTLLGSAKMVLETALHPGTLKDMVTSPGGTTIEGLHELEKAGLRGALINAVRVAAEKSRKLGQG